MKYSDLTVTLDYEVQGPYGDVLFIFGKLFKVIVTLLSVVV